MNLEHHIRKSVSRLAISNLSNADIMIQLVIALFKLSEFGRASILQIRVGQTFCYSKGHI